MLREPKSFEAAITATDLSSEDYCGTSDAAKLLGLSVATVQSLVEKGEIEAWKTLGGHRRIACLLYTSPSPRDHSGPRMSSSA